MNDLERRYYDCFVRIDQFGQDHAGDFSGVATATFDDIHALVNHVQQTGGDLSGAVGELSEEVSLKALARETLRADMSKIARTARGMVYAFPEIDELFRMPRNRNDADLLDAGRAFYDKGTPYIDDFKNFGMPDKWHDDLGNLCNNFEAALGATATAAADKVGKTAALADWIVQGSRMRRILDAIVRNVFADNVEKLAAWLSASHIEKPPKSKKAKQ